MVEHLKHAGISYAQDYLRISIIVIDGDSCIYYYVRST